MSSYKNSSPTSNSNSVQFSLSSGYDYEYDEYQDEYDEYLDYDEMYFSGTARNVRGNKGGGGGSGTVYSSKHTRIQAVAKARSNNKKGNR